MILIQCVFICLHVNMDLTLSNLRARFYFNRLVARNMPWSDIALLTEKFCELPGSMLDKLKRLHSEVFTEVHTGRLLLFLNFVVQLGLTEEEWEQLFNFLDPTLSQMQEWLYKWVQYGEKLVKCWPSQWLQVMGCWPSSPSLVLKRISSRIRVVLACCGGQVIVQNSEFCDGENTVQHLSRPKSTRKFRWLRCCVRSGQREGKN